MLRLDNLIRKYGEQIGREKYNVWHRRYRKANRVKLRKYWRTRRALQKANQNVASGVL